LIFIFTGHRKNKIGLPVAHRECGTEWNLDRQLNRLLLLQFEADEGQSDALWAPLVWMLPT
jgi:hypothetical protein